MSKYENKVIQKQISIEKRRIRIYQSYKSQIKKSKSTNIHENLS